ncbi:hypothetical protein [Jannaschia pohangensis]|uniref:Uncharacterized protein n=1 Tax=Jannaschia pohangensis TaxID=390807 RepID=A0A1I3Q2E7_9RHOB|nr:hypothetical protein [Jannaschia pohangensis]SFJ28018.1 hypothetical protein SAMN04488095_2394 [Jannaschia pohangensis]
MIRAAVISFALVQPAFALELEQCNRTTNVSHGGEAGARDLGAGYVAWEVWWAQEGVASDLLVADCRGQMVLSSRLREEGVRDRAFDRRDAGRDVLDRFSRRSPAFFALADLARDLEGVGRDTVISPMVTEACPCAALYPDARGDLPAFELVPVQSVIGDSL